MKQKLIIGLGLVLSITTFIAIGAYAGANLEEINVYLNKGVNVKLDGKSWQPKDSSGLVTYPITYNGTTYLPVKSIGDALGVKVSWDASSNSVLIDSPIPKATPVTNPIHTVAPTMTPAPTQISTISTKSDILNYLTSSFSVLKTSIGETKFTFDIIENNSTLMAYDYWVMINYDFNFFYELTYSNKITDEQRSLVKNELKIFSEKIGISLIEKLPSKKIYGGYYYSWYKYPTSKIDLITRQYFSWTNYDDVGYVANSYSATKPSTFRWFESNDDKL